MIAISPTAALLSGAAQTLDSFVGAVLVQQDACNRAVAQVEALRWPGGEVATVTQDGSVIVPPQPPAPAGLPTAGAPTSAEMLGRQRAAGDIRLWETSKTAAQRVEQSLR
ncbi:MAG: hypothetical protein ACYC1D_18780, partial [Acidimicrobiales bacterium]